MKRFVTSGTLNTSGIILCCLIRLRKPPLGGCRGWPWSGNRGAGGRPPACGRSCAAPRPGCAPPSADGSTRRSFITSPTCRTTVPCITSSYRRMPQASRAGSSIAFYSRSTTERLCSPLAQYARTTGDDQSKIFSCVCFTGLYRHPIFLIAQHYVKSFLLNTCRSGSPLKNAAISPTIILD